MFAVPIFDTLQSHRIAPSGTEDETEKGPLLMGRTSVSCDSLGAVEGAGQVILEADHAETFPCSLELLQKWLKKILYARWQINLIFNKMLYILGY